MKLKYRILRFKGNTIKKFRYKLNKLKSKRVYRITKFFSDFLFSGKKNKRKIFVYKGFLWFWLTNQVKYAIREIGFKIK